MGKLQKLNGIIDTATELVAIEGKPCFTCEWPTYDIGPNIRNGIATLTGVGESLTYG